MFDEKLGEIRKYLSVIYFLFFALYSCYVIIILRAESLPPDVVLPFVFHMLFAFFVFLISAIESIIQIKFKLKIPRDFYILPLFFLPILVLLFFYGSLFNTVYAFSLPLIVFSANFLFNLFYAKFVGNFEVFKTYTIEEAKRWIITLMIASMVLFGTARKHTDVVRAILSSSLFIQGTISLVLFFFSFVFFAWFFNRIPEKYFISMQRSAGWSFKNPAIWAFLPAILFLFIVYSATGGMNVIHLQLFVYPVAYFILAFTEYMVVSGAFDKYINHFTEKYV